jgi:hypothetical protein
MVALVTIVYWFWKGEPKARWPCVGVLVLLGVALIWFGYWSTTLEFPNAVNAEERGRMQETCRREWPWWAACGALNLLAAGLLLLPPVGRFLHSRREALTLKVALRYADMEKQIKALVNAASEAARTAFALDSIKRLHFLAKEPIATEFPEPDRQLLTEILAGVEDRPVHELKRQLAELNGSQGRDPARSIELPPSATELLGAIDCWLNYRDTGRSRFVVQIALHVVNSVDYALGGDVGHYSIDNMLGAPEMVEECERQQRILLQARASG